MDSITHSLYRAIIADNAHQKKTADEPKRDTAGLVTIGSLQHTHQAYAGAEGTDLYINLTTGDELLALQLEFIAAGFCPPANLYLNGADVIISPGRIELNVPTDNGQATWCATLEARENRGLKKAGWEEQTI